MNNLSCYLYYHVISSKSGGGLKKTWVIFEAAAILKRKNYERGGLFLVLEVLNYWFTPFLPQAIF